MRQWLPSILLLVIVAGVVGSILALRLLSDGSTAGVVDAPQAGDLPAVTAPEPALPDLATTRPENVASRGGAIRFNVRQLEPSYTVSAGDNLSSIAQRFNTSVEALQAINNLPDARTLSVGQRLVIP